MDIYDRRARGAASPADQPSPTPPPTRARAKRNKPMPLAMLHSGALDAAAAAPSVRVAQPAPASSSLLSRSASASSARFSAAHASPTSLALCFQFCSLRSLLLSARTCRAWQSAARLRTAWSEGRHWVSVAGSREELRHCGADDAQLRLEQQVRNFNPLHMHHSTTHAAGHPPMRVSSSAAASSGPAPSDPTPLQRLCRTPLLQHVRHLRYKFSSPSIRTSIALHSEDVFSTDVVTSRFPLEGLPLGALPFLASLALEDVTACSQPTLQSAFQSLGVQQHSHLRALRLSASPVLSDAETLRTLRAVLAELPSNLARLEVVHLPQRNLPPELPFDGFLALPHLHTLLLDASCTKTVARLQAVRAMALHGALRLLQWPAWRPSHMRLLFGGVRRDIEEEEAEAHALASGALTTDDAATAASVAAATGLDALALDAGAGLPGGEEEPVLGLDDEENAADAASIVPSSVQLGGRPSEQACFGFREWTVDRDVTAINLLQYFACKPTTLLPSLQTLSFEQPSSFASMVPALPAVLVALPSLTALRITVPHFSLGGNFFATLASLHLTSLRRLQLDQVSLVVLLGQDGSSDGYSEPSASADVSSAGLWSAFPALEELALLNMTLPPPDGLSSSCPRLQRVELVNVYMGGGTEGGTAAAAPTAPASLWIEELASLPRLAHLSLLHCQDADVRMLQSLSHCRSLERLRFCTHAVSPSHTHAGPSPQRWSASSLRHFDFTSVLHDDGSMGGGTADSSGLPAGARPALTKQSSGGSGSSQARAALSWVHQKLLALQRQQLQAAQPSASSSPPARVRISYCDDTAREQLLPALP